MVKSAWANVGFFLYQLDPKVRRLEHLHLKIKKNKPKKQTKKKQKKNKTKNNPQYSTKPIYIYKRSNHLLKLILQPSFKIE